MLRATTPRDRWFSTMSSRHTCQISAHSSSSASSSGILTVGQESTPNMPSLPGTAAELTRIQEKSRGLVVTQLDRDLATPAAVLAGMEEHGWVHLACHASQNTTDPIQSTFYLHNGTMDLASITQKPLKHAELAFLPAWQTTKLLEMRASMRKQFI